MRSTIVALIVLGIVAASCKSDDAELVKTCMPTSLWRLGSSDSIVYKYNDTHQLTALHYYYFKDYIGRKTELTYENGRITKVTELKDIFSTSEFTPSRVYTFEYNVDGLPSRLMSVNPAYPDEKIFTAYTYDANKRLIKGMETYTDHFNTEEQFYGGYMYDYNDKNNVVKIRYQVGENTEVVARENLTFDDRPVFYAGSKELAMLNVYVYKYAPNVNNVLTAKITYLGYDHSYMEPQDYKFNVSYDETGKVKGVTIDGALDSPDFGSLNFAKATYDCF